MLIKAIAGGGGRGMRRVDAHVEFDAALESAVREAEAAFGDGRVMIEKYIASPRHIELQVFADSARGLRPPLRARLLGPAPPSEGGRGMPRAGTARRDPRRDGEGRHRRCAGRRLCRRGHGRIHHRPGARTEAQRLLLSRDEHEASGRASGDRSGDRPRPGRMAVQGRRWRAAAAQAKRDPLLGRGDRSARLRRGPGARLSALGRAHPRHEPQGRGGPGRRPGRYRLHRRRQRHALSTIR